MESAFFPIDSVLFVAIILGEFVFGIAYNAVIALAERKHALDPYTAYAVALGVSLTIAVPSFLLHAVKMSGAAWAVLMLACFIGSGLPMIGGSMSRNHARQRLASRKQRARINGSAARTRDDVVMDVVTLAGDVAESNAKPAEIVNRLHGFVAILRDL